MILNNNFSIKKSSNYVPYPQALELMENRVAAINAKQERNLIWLLEHDHLYTSGTSARDNEIMNPKNFPVYKAGRGGKYTYHGPGVRIIYLMLDLKQNKKIGKDIRKYVYYLEELVIQILAELNIKGERRDDRIGIWVANGVIENKIAAIGVRVRKWITYHGIAMNLQPDLENFSGIIPCGIDPKKYGVTSIEKEGGKVDDEEFDKIVIQKLNEVFF